MHGTHTFSSATPGEAAPPSTIVVGMEVATAHEDREEADETVPHVIDRISEIARGIGTEGELPAEEPVAHGPITVEQSMDDNFMAVTLVDGRLTALRFDEKTSRKRVSNVVDELMALINAAHEAHEQAALDELGRAHEGFGALLTSLGHMQTELHEAYARDVRRLGG